MSGAIIKADKDYTTEVDKAIPEAEQLANVSSFYHLDSALLTRQQSNVQAAVEKLLALEKQTRQSSDLPSTSRLLVSIVTICKNAGDWAMLNEQAQLLSKKHSQLKQAITKMVQVVMGFLDDTPNKETKMSVIETLRTITEGKVGPLILGFNKYHTDKSCRSLSKLSVPE